jgi:hypothetical protein
MGEDPNGIKTGIWGIRTCMRTRGVLQIEGKRSWRLWVCFVFEKLFAGVKKGA